MIPVQLNIPVNKLVILAIAATVLTANVQPSAMAADADPAVATPGETMTLDNMQDVAYTLQRIRQQAINVYVEATRKHVYRFDLHVPSLSNIPTAPLEPENAYLPLRKGWLAFFIGSMEPLVNILNEHLKSLDQRTIDCKVPAQVLTEWKNIVGEWTTSTKKLNTQLDVCSVFLNDSKADNIEVAQAALAIDNEISSMESILYKAGKFLRANHVGK
jgi:hypothetical protein